MTVGAVLIAAAVALFAWGERHWAREWPLPLSFLIGIAGAAMFVAGLNAHLESPAIAARSDALRAAAARVSAVSAHDIYGQAATFNQQVRAARYYRHQWWSRPFTSACYDTLSEIRIP